LADLVLANEIPGLEYVQVGVGFVHQKQNILQILLGGGRVYPTRFVHGLNQLEQGLEQFFDVGGLFRRVDFYGWALVVLFQNLLLGLRNILQPLFYWLITLQRSQFLAGILHTFEQQQFEVWREVLAGNLGEQAVGLVVGIFLSRHFANAFDPRFFPHLAENNNNQGNGDDRGERSEERRVGTGWRRGGASEHE